METLYYLLLVIGIALLIITIEWNKIKRTDPKKIITILIILFFLGTALTSLF